jgi:hypothetical protein
MWRWWERHCSFGLHPWFLSEFLQFLWILWPTRKTVNSRHKPICSGIRLLPEIWGEMDFQCCFCNFRIMFPHEIMRIGGCPWLILLPRWMVDSDRFHHKYQWPFIDHLFPRAPSTVTGAHPQVHTATTETTTLKSPMSCVVHRPSPDPNTSHLNDEAIRWALRQFPSRSRHALLATVSTVCSRATCPHFCLNRMYSASDFLCSKRSNTSDFLNFSEKSNVCGKNDRNAPFSPGPGQTHLRHQNRAPMLQRCASRRLVTASESFEWSDGTGLW